MPIKIDDYKTAGKKISEYKYDTNFGGVEMPFEGIRLPFIEFESHNCCANAFLKNFPRSTENAWHLCRISRESLNYLNCDFFLERLDAGVEGKSLVREYFLRQLQPISKGVFVQLWLIDEQKDYMQDMLDEFGFKLVVERYRNKGYGNYIYHYGLVVE